MMLTHDIVGKKEEEEERERVQFTIGVRYMV